MQYPARFKRKAAAILALALIGGSASATFAANWTGLVSTNWADSGNWDTNAVPTTGQVANIVIGGLGEYDVNLNYYYYSQTALASIDVDSSTTRPNYSEVDQTYVREDLTVGELVVGNNYHGYWIDSAMLNNTINDDLIVGNASTANGYYNMSEGILTVAGSEYVGFGGQGTLNESGSSNTVSGNGLFLGYSSTGVGTYNLSALLTVANSEYVGYQGKGIFTQTANAHAINGTGASGLYLGWTASGVGTYNLAGGTLTVASNEDIGCTGNGTFIQTGGTNTTTSLYLGVNGAADGTSPASSGSYNMTGGSLISVGGSIYSYQIVGYYGHGSFAQHGGSNTLGTSSLPVNLYIGYYDGSSGVYTMDAAKSTPTLTVTGSEILGTTANVGYGGTSGVFNQSAGTHTVAGNLTIGNGSGSSGQFYLSGTGKLNVTGNEQIGLLGTGAFNQSGGANMATTLQIDPNATGLSDSFILSGGVLQVNSLNNNGSLIQSGGQLSAGVVVNAKTFIVSGAGTAVSVNSSFTNSGTAVLGGTQNWSTGATFINAAGTAAFNSDAGSPGKLALAVSVTGGDVGFASTQHLAAVSISNGATGTESTEATGYSVIVTNALSIGGTGKLNLENNGLDLPGALLSAMSAEVKQGYAGGTWDGDGITSSTAAADTSHLTAIGVIQNNQSGLAIYTPSNPFLLNMVPGSSDIVARFTYYGDANLDGQVDGSDYSLIDNGFINHLTGWFNGDFNYDGVVDGSDYALIDNAFNMQGAAMTAQTAAVIAGLFPASTVAVPEPTGLALLAIGGLALCRKRGVFSRRVSRMRRRC